MNKRHINMSLVDWSVFSMIIEARRIYLRLSQIDLSAQLGLSLDELEKVKNGKPASAPTYSILCEWYGVPHEWFYKDILCEKRQALS